MFIYSLLFDCDISLRGFPFLRTEHTCPPDWRSGPITMTHFNAHFEPTTSETTGVVHLYRHSKEDVDFDISQLKTEDIQTPNLSKLGTVVCVLGVPHWTTPQDFLKLMGPHRLEQTHMALVHDQVANRYMILIKFKNEDVAWQFYKDFNGRPFNSFESELCHVVYLSAIYVHDSKSSLDLDQPVIPLPSNPVDSPTNGLEKPKTMLELPTCPVCLERLDANVTGLLTTICNHTFHCNCIIKWGDQSCPICRYSIMKTEEPKDQTTACVDCGSSENLWICLICANVGCGRYVQKHAEEHYLKTNHIYALEIETQRVWDYAGDGYVHRIIQNKSDGKLVQLPAPATIPQSNRRLGLDTLMDPSLVTVEDTLVAEKMENLGSEYATLLHAQLSTQRHWYEHQIAKMEVQSIDEISRLTTENETMKQKHRDLETKHTDLIQESQRLQLMVSKLGKKL
ncbi:hypothetical protein EDD86DRAFT_205195, partial [Gorgonomyces haynaldii]